MDREVHDLAARVGAALKACGWTLVTAESCTGGWVAEAVTMVAGSSGWFERGFVTYADVAKQEMLGVRAETLRLHGAVSEQTVREMVEGALAHSRGDFALAVSGVAGPSGGTVAKPVGTVCLAWGARGRAADALTAHLAGDRYAIRRQSVILALEGVLTRLVSRA
jgi:nicotinamide-nucleotide amidase